MTVEENGSVEINCQAQGVPLPSVSWRREGNAFLPNGDMILHGNVLKIHQVRKEDRGIYYCFAENGVESKPERKDVEVVVEFAPEIQGGGGQVKKFIYKSK